MSQSRLKTIKLFVDSSDLEVIKYWLARGASGVTTNPSILATAAVKSGLQGVAVRQYVEERLREIVTLLAPDPVSIQVVTVDPVKAIEQALGYRSLGDNVVVKIPYSGALGSDLLPTVNALSSQDIPVNVTCIYDVMQMELALMNGARYVSPFIGRIWDNGGDPIAMLLEVRQLIDNEGLNAEIIAGSIRETVHVALCWAAGRGAHIVTAPPSVLKKLGQNFGTVTTTQEMLTNAAEAGLT